MDTILPPEIHSQMFPISGQNLENLIPQKQPFVLVSSLLAVSEAICSTTFTIPQNHVLCSEGQLSIAGLLENMAQSSGCKMGYEDFMAGKRQRRGFIGEIKDVVCLRLPSIGETLTTEVLIESKVFGAVTIVSSKVMSNSELLASCRMKIFFEAE
jgi:predicted hotdog family 3-hydroxylacyl-ACP dehydratase